MREDKAKSTARFKMRHPGFCNGNEGVMEIVTACKGECTTTRFPSSFSIGSTVTTVVWAVDGFMKSFDVITDYTN